MTSETTEAKDGTATQTEPSTDGARAGSPMHGKAEHLARQARELADEAGALGRKAARMFRKPTIGALVAGAAVLAAGAAWGASEAAVAAIAAYAVFRMLRKRTTPEPLSQP